MSGGARVSVDMRALERRLSVLRQTEIPSAIRNTLNDLAYDARGRIVKEIQRVFDKPTRRAQQMPWVDRAKVVPGKVQGSSLWLRDEGRRRDADRALPPHIPGQDSGRAAKGMERRLRAEGMMGNDEWLMPSKYAAANGVIDQYGNVKGAKATKMLADVQAYRSKDHGVASTSRDEYYIDKKGRRRKKPPSKIKQIEYEWGLWTSRNGVKTKGICKKVKNLLGGYSIVPIMVVVKTAPTYGKRLRFHDVVRLYSAQRVKYHADRAIAQAIRKRNA